MIGDAIQEYQGYREGDEMKAMKGGLLLALGKRNMIDSQAESAGERLWGGPPLSCAERD